MSKHLDGVSRLVFIGAGNMAEALVKGLVHAKVCPPETIRVTDIQPERLAFFKDSFGVEGCADNKDAVDGADVIVLAVKPQVLGEVLDGMKEAVPSDALILSIAAGITSQRIEEALGGDRKIVRSMPNTPALVGEGVAAIAPGRLAGDEDLDRAEAILGAVGTVVRVAEEDMDAVTALSGSGPAYVFYLVESMLKAAGELGLEPGVAMSLVGATVSGAARLMKETGTDPATLRARVTSKGGTTEAAVKVLEERAAGQAITSAVLAAQTRSRELSGGG